MSLINTTDKFKLPFESEHPEPYALSGNRVLIISETWEYIVRDGLNKKTIYQGRFDEDPKILLNLLDLLLLVLRAVILPDYSTIPQLIPLSDSSTLRTRRSRKRSLATLLFTESSSFSCSWSTTRRRRRSTSLG
jgi:hypothetical protein